MHIQHHPLLEDFPELRNEWHDLRQADPDFARMAADYESLDQWICRVEDGREVMADEALAALKQRRVGLKDEVAHRLKRSSGQCCGCGGGCRG